MRAASQINNRLNQASQRLSEISKTKSMSKSKFKRISQGSESIVQPLNFDGDKER